MILGVTGTRYGMTPAQQASFIWYYDLYPISEFHHGSCKGVDVDTARYVMVHGCPKCVSHPGPIGDDWREDSGVDDIVLPGKTHFARNRDIVKAVDILFVIPRENDWQNRGGTWYTHDHAVRCGITIIVIWPDGSACEGDARKRNPTIAPYDSLDTEDRERLRQALAVVHGVKKQLGSNP